METENGSYFYEITRQEARDQNAGIIQLLRIVLPLGILSSLVCAFVTGDYDKNLPAMHHSLLIFLLAVLARAAWVNRYYPYAYRTYQMDKEGITISKGKKMKRYAWKELEDYFVLGDRIPAPDAGAANGGSDAFSALDFRTVFYLNPKAYGWKGIMRKYIVIYGETDNSEKVNEFLASHLPRRKMEGRDEAGLMSYEFK